ncbi:MAG: type II and III secretion system protein, partial [Salibacteraceae bacterium]
AYELNAHYYLFSSPENKTTLYVENASFSDFLSYLFSGSEYTFKLSEDIYLIGKRNQERLRSTELITLENRTIESVQDAIPQELKKGLEIKEFPDLNGLIVSGSYTSIAEVNAFLRKIDRPVPVVLIDIMIVEVKKNFNVETGFQLTLDGESVPLSTTGEYNQSGAGISATLTSKTLNAILSSFTAPGLVNLGNLSPNFYASIQALESNGIIKRKSTPKLATMNGSEASLSLGEQTFYAETNNSFIGAQSPALSESTIYKPISADMTINIKPSVSSDEQITLSIDFSQSSFTNRIAETAPPGSLTKTFSSKIRVKNGETILLGGLDEEAHEKTGKGLPLIARIPILKWLLGSNTRSDSKSQISIFIQPTVIY